MVRTPFLNAVLLTFVLGLTACTGMVDQTPKPIDGPFGRSPEPVTQTQTMQTVPGRGQSIMDDGRQPMPSSASGQASGKVALLLPLSGSQSTIGQAMLQSAQLAVFDMGDTGIELLPIDTKGTPQGAAMAARNAAAQDAKLILGPLLADNVAAAGQTARQYNLNVVGFTTDWSKAGGNIFTIGILPFDQGQRLANYAAQKNVRNVLALTNGDAYSNAVISAFNQAARARNIQVSAPMDSSRISSLGQNAQNYDGVLIPYGGSQAIQTASALQAAGLNANSTLWMGTGLWDEAQIKASPVLSGAIYAAPSATARRDFEQNYRAVYGQTPPRLSSLAYDATALAIVLLRQNRTITPQMMTNPNGFAGIDGIFRFGQNGLAQRGLAVHKLTGRGNSVIVDQAPNSF